MYDYTLQDHQQLLIIGSSEEKYMSHGRRIQDQFIVKTMLSWPTLQHSTQINLILEKNWSNEAVGRNTPQDHQTKAGTFFSSPNV